MLSTRTSLSSSWLPQKYFLTVAEAANVQLLAYLKGKEGHHLKLNPNLSARNILLIEETTEFLFMKRHPIRHRGKKKKKRFVLWISQRPLSCLLRKVGQVNHLTAIPLYYHCISSREEYRRQPLLLRTFRTELCSSATGFQSEVLLAKAVSSMPFTDGNVFFFFFFPLVKLFPLKH